MKYLRNYLATLLVAALALVPGLAAAQVVASGGSPLVLQLPMYIDNTPNTVVDFGNGPLQFKILQGSAALFTSSSAGVGSTSGSSTTLTLTATPTTAPCVGCNITGTGITAGDTVISYNGGLIIGLSTARTVAASTAVSWGAACPATYPGSYRTALVQAAVGNDPPFYTYARICGGAAFNAGATVLPFPIGAH